MITIAALSDYCFTIDFADDRHDYAHDFRRRRPPLPYVFDILLLSCAIVADMLLMLRERFRDAAADIIFAMLRHYGFARLAEAADAADI